jgi:hypothetical protein
MICCAITNRCSYSTSGSAASPRFYSAPWRCRLLDEIPLGHRPDVICDLAAQCRKCGLDMSQILHIPGAGRLFRGA